MADKRPLTSFLGVGWAFPPAFSRGGAEVELVADEVDVHQSLAILLATRPGERPMSEEYGCALDEILFEELDQATVERLGARISDAILRHEPRIAVDALDVSPLADQAGALEIRIAYRILETNSRYNLVFPFYLVEAATPIR
ncbi:MAG: GPW/gp25 family protein [Myxococcales bacterium]|nr:GPW/gp25 family protein [Myxococcales bacterium]